MITMLHIWKEEVDILNTAVLMKEVKMSCLAPKGKFENLLVNYEILLCQSLLVNE
jgi:hypothetical protein